MYKYKKPTKTKLIVNTAYQGETIEMKVSRILNNKEPITDGAPLNYGERKNGINPDCDIRTDRWEHALDGMDKVTKTHLAKREERHNPAPVVQMDKDGKPVPVPGTGDNQPK